MGLEGAVAMGPVKLQSEYMRVDYNKIKSSIGSPLPAGSDIDHDGYYASASWMITGEKYAGSYKGGKFDRITPLRNFNPDDISKGGGAWEIGARYSKVDHSGLGGTTGTNINEASTYTAGLKWIPSPYVRVLLNYVDTQGEFISGVKTDQKAVTLRTQMDF